MSYPYDQKYFLDGMTGWHKDSFSIISNELLKFSQHKSFHRILDFGCGDGFYGNLLNQFSSNVDGFDISDAIIDLQNKSFYKSLFFNDLGKPISPGNNKYDLIFSSEVIEHVEKYKIFINNAFSLLNANGYIFLTTTTYSGGLFVYIIDNLKNLELMAFWEFMLGSLGRIKHRVRFTKRN